ncbi:MAG: Calx-beta domain-containing protein [Patescibacteria group bacterium]
MKRFIALVTFLTLAATLAIPNGALAVATLKKTEAKKTEAKVVKEIFSMKSVSQLTGEIASVDGAGNFVMIGKGKSQKKILVGSAVIVQVTKDFARKASVSDIMPKVKAHFWVKKKKTAAKEYEAYVVTQFVNALPTPAISVSFPSAAANGLENAPASLQMNLSAAATSAVKVDYTVGGTATGAGTDYTFATGSTTIAIGQTSATLPLNIVDDSLTEENETIIVTLTAATNAILGENKVYTYTIQDNDQPVVAFATTSSAGSEASTPVNLQVSLTKVSAQAVTVDYAVTGTATGAGTDYTLANGTATIPAGQSNTTIPLVITNDSAIEGDETVILTLSNVRGSAALGLNAVHTYTIQDNDQATFSFAVGTSTGLESVTPVNLVVNLSAVSPLATTVAYAVSGGTAAGGGGDFTLASGTLTIAAGQTSGNISLAVVDDAVDEVDETVIVTLSSPTNAVLGTNTTHTYTIQDNDVPTVQFSAPAANGVEGTAAVSIQIILSQAVALSGQVSYSLSGTAVGEGTDYILANGTLSFNAGQTSANISLTIVDDAIADPSETVILTLSNPVNATLGGTTVYTYTINDND